MSGGLPREQRRALPQATGVQDTSAGLRIAGAAAASSEQRLADALAPVQRVVTAEAERVAEESGRQAAAETAMVRDERGRLVIPEGSLDATPFMTRAQMRRREALLSRYASELTLDVNRDVLRLRDQHRDDPEAFRRAAEGWRAGLLDGMPAALRPLVGERAGQVIGQHYAHALDRRSQEDRAVAAELSRQAIGALGAEVSDTIAAGGDPTAAIGRLAAKIDADARVLGPAEAARLRRHYTTIVPAQAGVRRVLAEADIAGATSLVAALRSGDANARRRAIIAGFERAGYAEQNRAGSSAFGRYQITEGFYATLRQQDASLPAWEEFRRSPEAQERAMDVALAHYEREAIRRGIPFDDRVALGMHFLGAAGYARMRAAAEADPSAPVSRYVPEDAIRQNGRIFRDGEGRVRSVGEVMASLAARVPDFQGLSDQERRAIISAEDDAVTARRAEESRLRHLARQRRAARVGEITQRLAEIEDAVPADAALPADMLAEHARLTTELETLAKADGADAEGGGADASPAGRARRAVAASTAARQRGTAAGRQADAHRAEVARAAGIAESPDDWRQPTPEQIAAQQTLRRLDEEAEGLTATERMRFWRNARRQIQSAERQAAQASEDHGRLEDAWQGGARLANNARHQAMGVDWLRAQGVETFMEPNAPAAINHLARTGVVPQRVMNFMWGAIQSGDPAAYEQAAEIHRRMTRDPLTEERYRSAVDARVREAYRGVSDALAALPRGEQRAARVLQLIETSRRVAQGDPTTLQEMRATFGADAAAQNRAIAEAVNGALRERGLPERIPQEMREDLNTAFLHLVAVTGNRGTAATEAVKEVMAAGWTASTFGLPPAGAAALNPLGGEVNLLPGVGIRLRAPTREPHLMRHAPERITVPTTRGPSIEWQHEVLRDALAEAGISGGAAGRWRLGETAFLRPTEQFREIEIGGQRVSARLYEVHGPVGNGVIGPLTRRGPDGQPTAAPLRVALEAEAEQRRQAFLREHGPRMERRRQMRQDRDPRRFLGFEALDLPREGEGDL